MFPYFIHKYIGLYVLLLCTAASFCTYGQAQKYVDYYASIKNFDLSHLWCADSLPEPLGFVGEGYRRFQIHYTSVRQSDDNPYQYLVTGKTKVKNKISTFKGTITITRAELYKKGDDARYRQGAVYCDCMFYEDITRHGTGTIAGHLKTNWYIDGQQRIFYDDLDLVAEAYSNNSFTGKWTSYKRKPGAMTCNWGDYRIPACGDLDVGRTEFAVNENYWDNGWQTFVGIFRGSTSDRAHVKARETEDEQWWADD